MMVSFFNTEHLSSVVVYAKLTKFQVYYLSVSHKKFTWTLQCLRQVSSALLSVAL